MFTFFTIVFAIVWAVVSFILLFKVWDNIGPIVLSFSKSHIVQLLAMAIIFLIIWGVSGDTAAKQHSAIVQSRSF